MFRALFSPTEETEIIKLLDWKAKVTLEEFRCQFGELLRFCVVDP